MLHSLELVEQVNPPRRYKRGDTVEFSAPARLRRLQSLEVLSQPESADNFVL